MTASSEQGAGVAVFADQQVFDVFIGLDQPATIGALPSPPRGIQRRGPRHHRGQHRAAETGRRRNHGTRHSRLMKSTEAPAGPRVPLYESHLFDV